MRNPMAVQNTVFPLFLLCTPLISSADTSLCDADAELKDDVIACLEQRITHLEEKMADLVKSDDYKIIKYHPLEGFKKPKISQRQSAMEFDFDLRFCEREKQQQVSCHFTVKNTGGNATLSVNQDTEFYDQQGREYQLSAARIVDKKANFPGTLIVEKETISGIPIDMTITFNNVPLDCTRIAMLNIEGHLRKGRLGSLSLDYKNIAIVDTPEKQASTK